MIMKKRIILAIASVFILSATASAQTTSNSLLWEISGDDLTAPSYIFGTFHMMCEEDFEIKPKTIHALEKTKALFLELNYSDPNEIQEMQKMMQAEKKLSEQLSEKKAEELNDVLKSYQLTLDQVDHYSPQALYSLISLKAITCPPTSMKLLDIEIMQLALSAEKSVQGLETVADQIDFLGRAYDLEDAIEQLALGDDYGLIFEDMVTLYKEENLSELDQLLKDPKFMNAEQEKWMLTVRNENWANKIPVQMKKESTFFAVGAGHLAGKNGVLQLLKDKGYTVKPIMN